MNEKGLNFSDTLRLLKEGDKQITLDDHKNVILVLGNTGSGKSTLTQLLACDNNNLISKEVGVDTGEFIIEDLNDKISSNSTIFSKTSYPELVIDQKTDTAFYDCPGFSDTRNSSIDIASAYFIRKVLDHAESVKLIFIVNHDSVKMGMDRIDFMKLTKHVTSLIKNVDKFKDGIALFVTKVENSYKVSGGVPTLVSDSKILTNIENFLNNTRNDLELNLANDNNSNADQDKKIIKLIDIFLTKKNDELSKIALFRRPDRPGKLSEIELIQKGKIFMNNIIHDSLQYSQKTIEDFGYTISAESVNYINYLIEGINLEITLSIKQISNDFVKYYKNEENTSNDVYDLKHKFELGIANITKIIKNINPSTQPQVLITEFQKFHIPISENVLKNITLNGEYFDMLQKVSEKKFKCEVNDWKNEIMLIENILKNNLEVYNLITILFLKLSEYEVQTNLEKYSLDNFKQQLDIGLKEAKPIGTVIQPFLDNIYSVGNWDEDIKNIFQLIQNIIIDEPKAKFFYEMATSTLNTTTTFEFYYGVLHVHGDFVKMNDVVNEVDKIDKVMIRAIEIYALNKIFIDADFKKSNTRQYLDGERISNDFQLIFFAPTWEIIESKKIILNGDERIFKLTREDNSYDEILSTPPGTFLGFGEKFVNIQNLIINAKACDEFENTSFYHGTEYECRCVYRQNGEIKIVQTKSSLQNSNIYFQLKKNYASNDIQSPSLCGQFDYFLQERYGIFPINIGNWEPIIKKFQNYCKTQQINSFVKRKITSFSNQLNNGTIIPQKEIKQITKNLLKRNIINTSIRPNNFSFGIDIISNSSTTDYLKLNYENDTLPKNNINNISMHDFNSTLALMDVVTRKMTGSKKKFMNTISEETSYSNILANSLNIVDEFENMLLKLSKNMKIPIEIYVEGPVLVGKLQKLILNGNFTEISSKVLYDSVQINNKTIADDTKLGIKTNNDLVSSGIV